MIDHVHLVLSGVDITEFDIGKWRSQANLITSKAGLTNSLKTVFRGLLEGEIPAGALSAYAYGLSEGVDGYTWLRADPLKLEADHQRVFMRGYQREADPEKTSAALKNINTILAQDGLELIVLNSAQWLVKCKTPAQLSTHTVIDSLNRDILPLLPTGENQAYWRCLFTECQMIMQNCVNNSLWFWGAGALPEKIETDYDHVYIDEHEADAMIVGLIKQSGKMRENISDLDFFSPALERKKIVILANAADEQAVVSNMIAACYQGKIKAITLDLVDGRQFFWKISFVARLFAWLKGRTPHPTPGRRPSPVER